MGMNRTPIDSSMTIEKAISQGGYYNTDYDWNCVVTMDEYPNKILRGRVDVLVLKEGKLFMLLKDNGQYKIPGGGFDKGVLNKDQAFIETKEEAKLIVENVKFTGVTYTHIYDEIWSHAKNEIPYDGTYNEVYIAQYKRDYDGYIKKRLSDSDLTNNGKFYNIDDIKHILKEPHKQALSNMLNAVVTESSNYDSIIKDAEIFQTKLINQHKVGMLTCINPVEMEYTDKGLLFAEFATENGRDISQLKNFVMWSHHNAETFAYVNLPDNYNHGFLYIREPIYESSTYIIDESNTDQNAIDFFTEGAKRKNMYPVFIINSYTGGIIGDVITWYQQNKYAHSSISLDSSLEEMYSYNQEGFAHEQLSHFIKLKQDAIIQVKCIFIDKDDFKKIRERLDYLWSNKWSTRYGLENILNVLINRPIETTKDSTALICSQFVAWILSFADISLMDRALNLVTPKDFTNLEHPKVYLVYEGLARDYDKTKIDKAIKRLKAKAEFIKD